MTKQHSGWYLYRTVCVSVITFIDCFFPPSVMQSEQENLPPLTHHLLFISSRGAVVFISKCFLVNHRSSVSLNDSDHLAHGMVNQSIDEGYSEELLPIVQHGSFEIWYSRGLSLSFQPHFEVSPYELNSIEVRARRGPLHHINPPRLHVGHCLTGNMATGIVL